MRLAIIGDELAQDITTVADTCLAWGFTGIEVRSVFGTRPDQLTDGQLAEIRRVLADRGLAVAGFAPPVFKTDLPYDSPSVETARRSLLHAQRQAALLGAPHVRIFSWYRAGAPDPANAAGIAAEVLSGTDTDLPLLLENGTRTNTPTMTQAMEFLDRLGRDDVGVLWDPGNSVFSGWGTDPFPRDYLLAHERIRHVHVKDPRGQAEYVRLGEGDLPWPDILQRLATDRYDGFLSLETHWRIGRVLDQRQRDEPWGERFSAGGFDATVACMRQLKHWCGEVLAGGTVR